MTSLHVNVGDEFIREGIFSFIDELFEEWLPLYVNKVDLRTLHLFLEGESVSLNDKFHDSDVIVQAGAPVYWKIRESASYNAEWSEELWEKRIFQLGPEKPILNIAAGACQPYPDFAKTFLADPRCVQFAEKAAFVCRWTSVRDPLASQILYALGIPHEVLPCTAFHAARRVHEKPQDQKRVGVNLMPLGGHWKLKDEIDERRWSRVIESFLPELRRRHRLVFIAHDLTERQFMKRYVDGDEPLFYSKDFRDYIRVYGECAAVVANRVHGAICAAGFGIPSIILGNDTRLLIGDYVGIPSHYINQISGDEIIDLIENGIGRKNDEKDRLLHLREESAKRYRESIIHQLPEFFDGPGNMGLPTFHAESHEVYLRLASVSEFSSNLFRDFMTTLNTFARRWELHQFTNWSKIWEYPWLWFSGLSRINWSETKVLDIGSELGPMPWFLASIGGEVTLVETDRQWTPQWDNIARKTGLSVNWRIVSSEMLPFPDGCFDVVTSFSVIEHQRDKTTAVNEIARVLKPGGLFALSFDICEPTLGMTFPEWNGRALTMAEFEGLIWNHPEFDNGNKPAKWNVQDIPEFVKWHLGSAPHHNYTVGAAILRKRNNPLHSQ